MIIDKIAQKIIIKNLKHLREKGLNFINEHKEEILEAIKAEIKKYIEEHKEEVLTIARDKAEEIMKELML